MTRDLALITQSTIITVAAMICVTILVTRSDVDPVAALGVITAAVGVAGMALGRISGANQPPANVTVGPVEVRSPEGTVF